VNNNIVPHFLSDQKNKAIVFEKEITVHKDVTCFGNKYWIQIEDNEWQDNKDIETMMGKTFLAQLMFFTTKDKT
jgi:putative transposon-encoded protein